MFDLNGVTKQKGVQEAEDRSFVSSINTILSYFLY